MLSCRCSKLPIFESKSSESDEFNKCSAFSCRGCVLKINLTAFPETCRRRKMLASVPMCFFCSATKQVGVLTFDGSLHFYNLSPKLSAPQMMVVGDLDGEPFLPVPTEDLLVNLAEARTVVDALLESLPSIVSPNPSPDSALGPALQVCCVSYALSINSIFQSVREQLVNVRQALLK